MIRRIVKDIIATESVSNAERRRQTKAMFDIETFGLEDYILSLSVGEILKHKRQLWIVSILSALRGIFEYKQSFVKGTDSNCKRTV